MTEAGTRQHHVGETLLQFWWRASGGRHLLANGVRFDGGHVLCLVNAVLLHYLPPRLPVCGGLFCRAVH